jgi:hypothetical protein
MTETDDSKALEKTTGLEVLDLSKPEHAISLLPVANKAALLEARKHEPVLASREGSPAHAVSSLREP